MKIQNPYTFEVIDEVAEDNARTIGDKFIQAKKAQIDWGRTNFAQRHKTIAKFSDLLQENIEGCALITTKETGKPLNASRNEIKATNARIQFFLDRVASKLATREVFDDGSTKESLSFDPLGVIANISAWNFPYFVGINVFIPALLTGNAVLYKPSEFATLTGLKLVDLMKQAGLPAGLFAPIIGQGEQGKQLLDEKVDGVFFTGSNRTGKSIAQQVAGRMIKSQFELGGKDPLYVCDDFDVQNAAESVLDGACYNAGQSCCGVERVYVHEKVYNEFLVKLTKLASDVKMGDPMLESTYLGPMTQPDHLQLLELHVQDAVAKGAKLLVGGARSKGHAGIFEPTVLTDVTHEMLVMKDETFGPIMPIMKVSNDEEAIRLMNDTEFGLTSSVFTENKERAKKILTAMNSGTVYWNCCDRVSPHLPWSGRGQSGEGYTLSELGIEIFLKPKAWQLRG